MSHPQDNTYGLMMHASQKRLRRLAAWSIPLVAAACVFASSDMAHAEVVLAETGMNQLPLLFGSIGMVGIGVLVRRFAS